MDMNENRLKRINVCMLLELQYKENMEIYPTHEIMGYLTNFGHNVTWILSSDEINDVLETTYKGVHIFVIPSKNKEGILKVISKSLYAIRRMHFLFKNFNTMKYDMIFVRNGVFDAFLALCIRRKHKIPFIYEMDNPLEQMWVMEKCFWYYFSKTKAYIAEYILSKADLVLPISKWLMEDFSMKGIDKSKMIPLPEGVNPERFSKTNENEIRKRFKLGSSMVIIYIGTMAKLRHLSVLIYAFSKVRYVKENIKLLMVGDGTDKHDLEKLATVLGINDDVIFTGHVPFNEVPDFIAAADVGVSAVPPLDFYKLSSPIKILEYMAAAKPVVANEEIPDHKEIVEESGGGVLVKFEDVSFAEGIIQILNYEDRGVYMGRKGQEWVFKHRSYEHLAKTVEKAFYTLKGCTT